MYVCMYVHLPFGSLSLTTSCILSSLLQPLGKKEPPFPLKLHQILSNPEFQECICWNPHGQSWRILKPPVFEQVVIPLYFRHAKYASFMRQVNGWGFKRIVSGNDHNSYYHELFVRDCPQLCLKMKRMKKDGDSTADEDKEKGSVDGSSGEHRHVGPKEDEEERPTKRQKAHKEDEDGSSQSSHSSDSHHEAAAPANTASTAHAAALSSILAGGTPASSEATMGRVDSATLSKLQEALAAAGGTSSFFGQQGFPTGLSLLHGSGPNVSALLASQLQAASQPPNSTDENNKASES
jgi:hypothetical protein